MATMRPTPGACPEKERLVRAYKIAAADYARSTTVLYKRIGVLTQVEYNDLKQHSEKARHIAEMARTVMDGHVAEHGC